MQQAIAVGTGRGGGLAALALWPGERLLAQRGHLFPWVPVAFGSGIGLYFLLQQEPGLMTLTCVALAVVVALAAVRPLGAAWGPLALAVALAGTGFLAAAARTHWVAAPVLDFRYYGPVEGRIVEVDRSASDAVRLTLDRVVMDMPPERTPARVRISLQGDQRWLDPVPGSVVILTAHLTGPNGPVSPGDFDFRLSAWFERLGAVGYTRTPVLLLTRAEGGMGLWIAETRVRLARAILALVPGDAGGLAAAVMTGDRSGLSVPASDAMRDANLYHIVSISGMHMGMLTGIVFGLIRSLVALVPPLALRLPGKKVAALVALPVAAFYLALAGRDVATERAFVMVAVMLGAVLLDRQALSLRSVAMAALVVLALRPESLMNPGFQMSFAAVIALIVAFQALKRLPLHESRWRWLAPAGLLVFSSLVAGLATAPFAAAHFNRIAHYGLVANLLAVPVMGLAVMPGAVLLAILGPFGVTEPARSLIDYGCRWVLWVSEQVAATQGAVTAVAAPPAAVVPLMTLGALFAMLWQGRGRWLGLVPVAAAFVLWAQARPPDLLVAASGGIAAVATEAGLGLSRAEGEAFVAGNWIENAGLTLAQTDAARGWTVEGAVARAEVAGLRVTLARGKTGLAAITGCDGAVILIATEPVEDPRPCLVLDLERLRMTGAVAAYAEAEGLRLVTAAEVAGSRPWTGEGAAEGLGTLASGERREAGECESGGMPPSRGGIPGALSTNPQAMPDAAARAGGLVREGKGREAPVRSSSQDVNSSRRRADK